MAFKINSSIQKPLQMPQSAPLKPQSQELKPAIETPLASSQIIRDQHKFPSQNLLDKYSANGNFYNTQNALGAQLGVDLGASSSGISDEGKAALLEYLQGNNTALQGISELERLGISELEGAELESEIKRVLAGQKDIESDFLGQLLQRVLG